jgi:rhamnulokinase
MEELIALVGRGRLYEITGIQFHAINTLVQLRAACRATPEVIGQACTLLTIADYFNFRLTGRACAEYTIASTTQCLDARTHTWAVDLLTEVDIPSRLFAPIVEPGTIIGSIVSGEGIAHAGTPVVATACHDTASAFAAVRASSGTAFLSSGTWSLLGAELPAPILSAAARDANFTNEGGACGTFRFLKNISGLWLLEACRRSWDAAGRRDRYEDLLNAAADAPAFQSLVDPDDDGFLSPADMPGAIDRYCRRTEQPAPHDPPAYTRAILESLACKYRFVIDSLERLTGVRVDEIRVVGGGSQNQLLNQFTADATGRRVVAGPVEATALGNIAVQMLATGAVGSLAESRAIVERSFPVERYDPVAHDRWDAEYGRFKHYVEDGRG